MEHNATSGCCHWGAEGLRVADALRLEPPNVWRQGRAQRSGASPLHAGVRPRRRVRAAQEQSGGRQESSLVETDARAGYDAEACLISDLKGRREGSLRDVKRWLDDEQLGARGEERTELGKECPSIRMFVNDVEREHEIEVLGDADTIRLALMKSDARV